MIQLSEKNLINVLNGYDINVDYYLFRNSFDYNIFSLFGKKHMLENDELEFLEKLFKKYKNL